MKVKNSKNGFNVNNLTIALNGTIILYVHIIRLLTFYSPLK